MSRQESFVAGELAPGLWGRTSHPLYAHGARRLRDFMVAGEGAAATRPSTRYMTQSATETLQARLLPFAASDGDDYVLEFSALKVRVWRGGAFVLEVATPYSDVDVQTLRWAQSGDVLTLVCHGHAPRELRRLAHASWQLVVMDYTAPSSGFSEAGPAYLALQDFTFTFGSITWSSLESEDEAHPKKRWQWAVTTLFRAPDGALVESFARVVAKQYEVTGGTYEAAPEDVAVYPDKPVRLRWPGVTITPPAGHTVYGHRVYRGRDGLFGYLGQTTTSYFMDEGEAPDFVRQPPTGADPFFLINASIGDPGLPGYFYRDNPGLVAYYEDRLVLAATPERPETLWASWVGDYRRFDTQTPSAPTEAVVRTLGGRTRESLRWMHQYGRSLLLGTDSTVRALSGGPQAPFSVYSAETEVLDEVGCAALEPLLVAGHLLYAREKGAPPRALRLSQGGAQPVEVGAHAAHFFRGHSLVSWCLQARPHPVVWAVRDDGALLSCTPTPDGAAWGWALHRLAGEYTAAQSVTCVREGGEDVVHLAVKHLAFNTSSMNLDDEVVSVLRLAPRAVPTLPEDADGIAAPDPLEAYGLDFATTYRGVAVEQVTAAQLVGYQDVYAVADGHVVGPLQVGEAPENLGTVTLPEAASVVHVGLRFQPELETLNAPQAPGKQKTVRQVLLEVLEAKGAHVGEGRDNLVEWQQRTVGDVWAPLNPQTGLVEFSTFSAWNTGGRVVVRQQEPLPLTLVSLTRELVPGG